MKEELLDKIEELYDYDTPQYLRILSKNRIQIKAGQWEGSPTNWITITIKDIIKYYHNEAGNITSGIRSLSTFSTDWRMVDGMAKECLEIFKVINIKALEKEGNKFGMVLK